MHRLARPLGLALLIVLASSSYSQGQDRQKWAIHAGYTHSATILGSRDQRRGMLFGLQRSNPEPRMRWRAVDGEIVYEAYAQLHHGGDLFEFESDVTLAAGILVLGRWSKRYDNGAGTFFELGWGLQVQDRSTHDLNARLNSTPVAGLGGFFPVAGSTMQITLRAIHISNAGSVPPNLGQNQMQLLVGLRF